MARLILTGTAPASLPFEIRNDTEPVFDWRALQRWRISQSRLPPNSIVRFHPQSMWEQYRWAMLGALVMFALQAALISGLLIQRHDDINQQLASLSIALSSVKRRVQNRDMEGVRAEVARLQQRIIDVTHATRQISHELHPGLLKHAGLVAALRSHCAQFAAQHGIEVTFSAAAGINGVRDDTALCLYRITQEALRNIATHAGARTAQVALSPAAANLELIIHDDGRGFDLAVARRRGGIGLVSLDERVRLIGGSLQIETQPQRGTELRVLVPM
jgi:signal transduction histidine kinase